MTKQEMLQALEEGKKVTHRYFTDEEWVRKFNSFLYEFEDGNRCLSSEFWRHRTTETFEKDWEIVND